MLKKICLSIVAAFFLLVTISVPFASAEGVWYDQTPDEWYQKVYDENNPQEIFGERYTAAQVQWVIYGLFSQITLVPKNIKNKITNDDKEGFITELASLFSNLANLQASNNQKYSPLASILGFSQSKPISGIEYVKYNLSRFHLIPTASAQEAGFGYKNIKVVMDMWKAVRNFAYALTTIGIIVLAFMIMFRVKINPQTVVTVQSSIPKVAIALILITFSYAIAGFLVDLMYVVIGIMATLFQAFNPLADLNLIDWYQIMTNGFLGLGIFGNYVIYLNLFWIGTTLSISSLIPRILGETLISGSTGGIGILTYIITAVLSVLFLFQMIKVVFLLFKTLAGIYIGIIFAPFQIGMGIINSNMGFGSWIKSFIANLAVFPVISALFCLAFIFAIKGFALGLGSFLKEDKIITLLIETLNLLKIPGSLGGLIKFLVNSISSTETGGNWPLLNSSTGGESMNALIFMGVSFVVITLVPKAADIIKSVIEGKPFGYGTAVGEAFGPAKMGASAGAGYVGEYAEQVYGATRKTKWGALSAAAKTFQQLLRG